MYKTPELTTMAKLLRTELAGKGLALSHAQAMELAAKASGARTLHVAQAQAASKKMLDVDAFAAREAARQMFSHLGSYEGRVLELMADIRAAFAHESSRETESAIHDIEVVCGVKLSEEMEPYRWDELQTVFDRKVGQIKQLAFQFGRGEVQQDDNGREILWRGQMQDWMVEDRVDDQELTPRQKRVFDAVITRAGSQLVMDISLPHTTPEQHAGTDSLSLFIEINKGMPCVHLSNDMYGDQVLTVFGLSEGLYLRPDEGRITTGIPGEGGMREFIEEDRGNTPPFALSDAFIESSNKD